MKRSGRKNEPLLVFKFFCYSFDFWLPCLSFEYCNISEIPGIPGFTNVCSNSRRFPISFSENHWQNVNSSRRRIYNASILLETHVQIWQIFSHLLEVLLEKYGPITNFFNFVNPSGRFQVSLRFFVGLRCFII